MKFKYFFIFKSKRSHIRQFGQNKYNQVFIHFGSKFRYGEGKLFISFPDDKTSGIVHTKIFNKTNATLQQMIKEDDSAPRLRTQRTSIVDDYCNGEEAKLKQPSIDIPINAQSRLKPVAQRMNSNDYIDVSTLNTPGAIKTSPDLNDFKNKPKPELPPRPPAKPANLLNNYNNSTLNTTQNEAAALFKPIIISINNANKNLYTNLYNKLLNTPKKVLEAKRLKEIQRQQAGLVDEYEIVVYED